VQRMSVICKVSNDKDLFVYSKGSPEMMFRIMKSSTVPSNYNEVLKEYTSNGFRVLAIASRKITGDITKITRK
jgi:magnesium-transporting ATPase (P-type)